jgi:hypothetical protein
MLLSLLSNAHLHPIPGSVSWKNDEKHLTLKTLPDAIILGDKCEVFEVEEHGCTLLNPSSFTNEFTFFEFNPNTKQVQWNKLK